MTIKLRYASFAIMSALALSACGGGGGSKPTNNYPNNPPPTNPPPVTDPCVANPSAPGCTPPVIPPATAWVNPGRVTVGTEGDGNTVFVAVLDGGFKSDQFEIKDHVAGTLNLSYTDSVDGSMATDVDFLKYHGAGVAQVIAGEHVGYSGNASLYLARIDTADGLMNTGKQSEAIQWAVQQGARVINQSYGPAGGVNVAVDTWTRPGFEWAQAGSAVTVMAAGNEKANLSKYVNGITSSIFTAGNEAFRDSSLIVGGLYNGGKPDANGYESASSFAGERADVQNRFLMASWTQNIEPINGTSPVTSINDTTVVAGTSVATPQVSAAAATLMAQWPALTGQQIANILLTTTDRTFTDAYNKNTCGDSGTVNCGLYSYGMGLLDLKHAMQPSGSPTLAMSSSVSGPGVALASTHLTLPAAFGDAGRGLAVDTMALDSYGRDYQFRLSNLVSSAARWTSMPMLSSSALSGSPVHGETEQSAYWARMNAWGQPGMMGFQGKDGPFQLMGFTGAGADGNAFDRPTGLDGVNLIGYTGGTLSTAYTLTGVGLRTPFGRYFSLEGHSVTGQERDGQLSRQEVELGFSPRPNVSMKVGYAVQSSSSALGAMGVGALSLGAGKAQSVTFGADVKFAGAWSAFIRGEVGKLSAAPTQSLITSLDVNRMSQVMAGLSWSQRGTQAAFVVGQPLRVDSATASLNVPVARTVDGAVIRQSQTASLAPSGRQINAEFALSQQLTSTSSVQFNAVYARDPGHQANAAAQSAVYVRYARAW